MCAVLPSSLGTCWGLNSAGQLGNGRTNALFNNPVLVSGLSNLVDIAVGPTNSCAATSGGAVFCWGSFFGPAPTPLAGITDAVQLAATSNNGSSGAGGTNGLPFCARRSNGRVSCWSDTGVTEDLNLDSVARLSMGNGHACAVTTNGELFCWGSNSTGELGIGINSNPIDSPTRATVFADVADVATGNTFTCVQQASGAVRCVGNGLLLGSDGGVNVDPFDVNVTDTAKLVAGEQHACALSNTGQVRCWGAAPQSAGGTDAAPAVIALPGSAIDVGAGSFASCALLDDTSIYCWGTIYNTGSSTSSTSATPIQITGLDSLF
jgi:alpha-tubulin suppressor-like RCC1 family protein